MARVTVEDCLEYVDNRFDLVLLVEPLLPWENDKPTVMALREIAEGLISHRYVDQKPEEELVIEDHFADIDSSPMMHSGD